LGSVVNSIKQKQQVQIAAKGLALAHAQISLIVAGTSTTQLLGSPIIA
jgi:hypothetical protein